MPITIRALCKPELVKWAREQSRLPLDVAAKKLSIAPERLSSWESGTNKPTINQLRNISRLYRYPLSFFYLPQIPVRPESNIPDYRRLPDSGVSNISPDLASTIRSVTEKREILLELMQNKNESPTSFQYFASPTIDPENLGNELRNIFGITDQIQSSWRDPRIAFNSWREIAEDLGVFVIQTKNIPLNDLRAFSIYSNLAPLIILNRKDTYAGRIFSLLHEFTHLLKRSSALCDMKEDNLHLPEDQTIEIYCNHVAGACLVPKSSIENNQIVLGKRNNPIYSDDEMKELATHYSVSREVVLRRLLILNKTTQEYYEQKRSDWNREYASRPKPKGFTPVPTDIVSLLGKPYVKNVIDSYKKEYITAHVLSDYLGAKLKHLNSIEAIIG